MTQRDSQVPGRKAGALPVFTTNRDCLAYSFAQWSPAKSANIPLHFGLSLCSLWQHINLPYNIWKRIYIAFIWGITPDLLRGCRVIKALHVFSSFTASKVKKSWAVGPSNVCLLDFLGTSFELAVLSGPGRINGRVDSEIQVQPLKWDWAWIDSC